VPIVCLGAPLGAWVAGRVSRDAIIYLLLGLIALELVTTVILLPFTPAMLTFAWVTVVVCIVWFAAMLSYRQRFIKPVVTTDPPLTTGPLPQLSVE
jgi:predicted MFS family arabinose efflux permease